MKTDGIFPNLVLSLMSKTRYGNVGILKKKTQVSVEKAK
jgi:hypothetical protein